MGDQATQVQVQDLLDGTVALGADGPEVIKFIIRMANPKGVPEGIPKRDRDMDHRVDTQHARTAIEAGHDDRADTGRVRDGRVDTGDQIIKQQGVQIALLRTGLANNGYRLVDAYHQERENWNQKQHRFQCQQIVALVYARADCLPVEPLELQRATLEGVRELGRRTYNWCNVWDNRVGGDDVTVNVSGGQPDARPQRALVVRESELKTIPVDEPVDE